MPTTPDASKSTANTTLPSLEEQIVSMVFMALQKDLASQVPVQIQASSVNIWMGLKALAASVLSTQGGLEALATCMADMEQGGCGMGLRPSISPPKKYERVSKLLVDQFVCQVKAAVEFRVFENNHQKILWTQSYLTGLVQAWLYIITLELNDKELNPRRFQWVAWLMDFKAAFGMWEPAQDALK
ncbi:hypothetical protein C0993_005237 [Termitomyces sp. T159_Od127]|nr:hypothetical protein C0993_005237 [Termitomyces sp. T159_Od127]